MLLENYSTHKELTKLSDAILSHIAKKTHVMNFTFQYNGRGDYKIEDKPEYTKDVIIDTIKGIPYIQLDELDNSEYTELADFIKKSGLTIRVENKRKSTVINGETRTTHGTFNNQDNDIELYDNIIDKLNNNKSEPINCNTIYIKLFYAFDSVLLHELQHAYDNYRSNKKAMYSNIESRYRLYKHFIEKYDYEKAITEYKKYMHVRGVTISDNQLRKLQKMHAKQKPDKYYLLSQEEADARFTQALKYIRFYHLDDNWEKVINPFAEIKSDLLIRFDSWDILKNNQKRSYLTKLYKHWDVVNDGIKNQKTTK